MKKLIISVLMFCFVPVLFTACDDTASINTNYSLSLAIDPDAEYINRDTNANVLIRVRVYDSKGNMVTDHGNITWVLKYIRNGESNFEKIPDDRFISSKPYSDAILNISHFFAGDFIEISAYYLNAKQTVTFTVTSNS